MVIGEYSIGGYQWLFQVKLSQAIGDYQWLLYLWLLVVILLQAISGYLINGC